MTEEELKVIETIEARWPLKICYVGPVSVGGEWANKMTANDIAYYIGNYDTEEEAKAYPVTALKYALEVYLRGMKKKIDRDNRLKERKR